MWSLKLSRQYCSTFSMVGVRLRDWAWRFPTPWSGIFRVWLKLLDHPKWRDGKMGRLHGLRVISVVSLWHSLSPFFLPFILARCRCPNLLALKVLILVRLGSRALDPMNLSAETDADPGTLLRFTFRSTQLFMMAKLHPENAQEFQWSRNNPEESKSSKLLHQITKHHWKLKQTSTKYIHHNPLKILPKINEISFQTSNVHPKKTKFPGSKASAAGCWCLSSATFAGSTGGVHPKMVR